jgi:hypothetical protein
MTRTGAGGGQDRLTRSLTAPACRFVFADAGFAAIPPPPVKP